jgi:hypothetical protein
MAVIIGNTPFLFSTEFDSREQDSEPAGGCAVFDPTRLLQTHTQFVFQ